MSSYIESDVRHVNYSATTQSNILSSAVRVFDWNQVLAFCWKDDDSY